jgi:site-specific DNA-methyltransferase (adenine-specific)
VAANVQAHGCGALNIDGCRIEGAPPSVPQPRFGNATGLFGTGEGRNGEMSHAMGRWPANLVLGCACTVEHEPDCAVALLDAQSGELQSGDLQRVNRRGFSGEVSNSGKLFDRAGDTGGASRFFYTSKASRDERERGLEHRQRRVVNDGRQKPIDNAYQRAETQRANIHPTVKPVSLMRWLVRLVGGKRGSRVLDPFCGSGTTGVACELEGFDFVGIDLEPEHCEIARARILAAAEEAGTATAEQLDAVSDRTGPVQLGLLETGR